MGLLNSGKLASMRSAALEDFYTQAQSILIDAIMFMGGAYAGIDSIMEQS